MDDKISCSQSGATTGYYTVFIDTSLDTHLAMIVSDSETVSDLKKKVVHEHPLCFPELGEIEVHALKVERKGYLYCLSNSMYVKSAFDGMMGSWFLSADASSLKGQNEIPLCCKPDSKNACLAITYHNTSADVVDLLPDGPSKRISNVYDFQRPQIADKLHERQNLIAQEFGSGNSSEEVHDNAVSVGGVPKDSNIAKEKHKSKTRNKDVVHDYAARENELVTEAVHVSKVENVAPDITFVSAKKVLSLSHNSNGENQHIDTSNANNEFKSAEETLESGPAKKKHKTKKVGAGNASLTEHGALVSKTFKKASRLQETSSNLPLVEKLQSGVATSMNAKHLVDNHMLTDTTSSKQRKRKRQASNSSEVVGAIASVENVGGESCGVTEVINRPDLGREADAALESGKNVQGGTVDESKVPSPVENETGKTGLGILDGLNEAADLEVAQAKDTSTQKDRHDARNLKPVKSSKKIKKTKKTQVSDVVTSIESEVEHLRGSVNHISSTELPTSTNENDMSNTGIANVENKNEADDLEAVPMKGNIMLVDQDPSHVEDHSSHMIQEPNNLQESRITVPENPTVAVENETVKAGKSLRKRKKSEKTQDTDVEASVALEREHVKESSTVVGNGESKNDAAGLETFSVRDANLFEDQHASHVEDLSSPMIQEPNNLLESRVTGFENLTVAVEVESQEVQKSAKKTKKSRRTQDPDVGTSVALGAEHLKERNDGIGYRESKDGAADNLLESRVTDSENPTVAVEVESQEVRKSAKKIKKSRRTRDPDVGTSVALGAEHLRERNNGIGYRESKDGAADTEAVLVKDTSMLLDQHNDHVEDQSSPISLQGINLQESRVTGSKNLAATSVIETLEAGKSSRKPKKSRKAQGSDMETPIRESLEDISLNLVNGEYLSDQANKGGSAQLKEAPTLETKSATPDNEGADDVIRDVLESLQQSHKDKDKRLKKKTKKQGSSTTAENADTERRDGLDSLRELNPPAESSKLADNVADIKGAEDNAVVVKKKKKPDLSAAASSDLQQSVKSSENRNNGGFAEAAVSGPVQKHKSALKDAKESDSLIRQSKKKPPSVPGSRKEPPKSNEYKNKSGNEHKSHLTASKAPSHNSGADVDSSGKIDRTRNKHQTSEAAGKDRSDRKRSLLETSGTIFKDDGKDSSDDDDKPVDSDATTRTPPNISLSSDSSDNEVDSKQGPYGQKEEGVGGRNKKKPLSSSPRSGMSLAAILRSSSRYRQAKITASQSQGDDSQLEETVPDSQPR